MARGQCVEDTLVNEAQVQSFVNGWMNEWRDRCAPQCCRTYSMRVSMCVGAVVCLFLRLRFRTVLVLVLPKCMSLISFVVWVWICFGPFCFTFYMLSGVADKKCVYVNTHGIARRLVVFGNSLVLVDSSKLRKKYEWNNLFIKTIAIVAGHFIRIAVTSFLFVMYLWLMDSLN